MGFLPRLTGGNENNLVKLEATGYLARGNQVSVVDWVKCAPHNA